VRNERNQRLCEVSGRGVFTGGGGRVMQTSLRPNEGRTLYAREPTRSSRCSATSRRSARSGDLPDGAWEHATSNGSFRTQISRPQERCADRRDWQAP
jgi:hypothetical protein